jgi:hypothetical protein
MGSLTYLIGEKVLLTDAIYSTQRVITSRKAKARPQSKTCWTVGANRLEGWGEGMFGWMCYCVLSVFTAVQ